MRPSPSRIGPQKGKSAPVDGLLAFHALPLPITLPRVSPYSPQNSIPACTGWHAPSANRFSKLQIYRRQRHVAVAHLPVFIVKDDYFRPEGQTLGDFVFSTNGVDVDVTAWQ